MFRIVVVLGLLFVGSSHAAIGTTFIASYAEGLLRRASVPGQRIRMCSCTEQRSCVAEMEQQVLRCSDSCSSTLRAITPTPQLLIPCFVRIAPKAQGVADCLQSRLQTCTAGRTNQMVPYTSFNQLLNMAESDAYGFKDEIASQKFINRVRPLVDTAFSYGSCVKRCFMNTNRGGYCFDRMKCQPRMNVSNLAYYLKGCTRGMNWKKEAGSLCTCAQYAGVTGLQGICPLLNVMG